MTNNDIIFLLFVATVFSGAYAFFYEFIPGKRWFSHRSMKVTFVLTFIVTAVFCVFGPTYNAKQPHFVRVYNYIVANIFEPDSEAAKSELFSGIKDYFEAKRDEYDFYMSHSEEIAHVDQYADAWDETQTWFSKTHSWKSFFQNVNYAFNVDPVRTSIYNWQSEKSVVGFTFQADTELLNRYEAEWSSGKSWMNDDFGLPMKRFVVADMKIQENIKVVDQLKGIIPGIDVIDISRLKAENTYPEINKYGLEYMGFYPRVFVASTLVGKTETEIFYYHVLQNVANDKTSAVNFCNRFDSVTSQKFCDKIGMKGNYLKDHNVPGFIGFIYLLMNKSR